MVLRVWHVALAAVAVSLAGWALLFGLAWLVSAAPGAWLLIGVAAVAWLVRQRELTVAERARAGRGRE